MTKTELRTRLLETNERVRITRNGEVHAYGRMPNTNRTGWYLVGFSENLIDEYEYADKYAHPSLKASVEQHGAAWICWWPDGTSTAYASREAAQSMADELNGIEQE